jgi:protein subunit release factor B
MTYNQYLKQLQDDYTARSKNFEDKLEKRRQILHQLREQLELPRSQVKDLKTIELKLSNHKRD